MSQMDWFKKLSTCILIILANYYDYVLGRRACCTHFCITDDLEKSNEMITFCVDHVREFMTEKMLHARLLNHPTHIYSWEVTMQQTKPRTTITLLGWSIMLRRTMDYKPSSKISLQNSTGKVKIFSS